MNVTRLSEDELELRDRSPILVIIVGAGFFVAGLFFEALVYLAGSAQQGGDAVLFRIFFWLGLTAILIGILLLLYDRTLILNANRSSGRLRCQWVRVFGSRSKTYLFADVGRIEKRKIYSNDPDPDTMSDAWCFIYVIVFRHGKDLWLGGTIQPSRFSQETATAVQLAEFLNVPFLNLAGKNPDLRDIEL
jgi:hypothetical protein